MASLLSDLCALVAQRAAMALDERPASEPLDHDEALALSRLLQLCSALLDAGSAAARPADQHATIEELLDDARGDAALVEWARDARRTWRRHEASAAQR